MSIYWEDRVTKEQYDAIEKASKKFQRSKKDRTAQDIYYDSLTNNGMTSEEADEYINLVMDGV